MNHSALFTRSAKPMVVGSFGSLRDLVECSIETAREACEVIEIRLDVLARDGWKCGDKPWQALREQPLLFTARRQSEGGVLPLDADARAEMIAVVCEDAAAVDVEISSIDEMNETIRLLARRNIPWVASSHDFHGVPAHAQWREWRDLAMAHGASVAKFAAMLHQPNDIDLLESFQRENAQIAVATMGMGPLAPESRIRCAIAGSLLNYGYMGSAPTAPGQWRASDLRKAIIAATHS